MPSTGSASYSEGMGDASAQAVRELYAGPPAEFVARRTALARQLRASGDRDEAEVIAALRKPTTAADSINRVVHAAHPAVAELVHLGALLRQAQSALDATQLSALRIPRDAVLLAWGRATQEVSGRHTPAVQAEIRDTVIAALADVGAQDVVCSGALTRALSYSGFGEVDLSDAVARTSTGVLLTRVQGGAGSAGTSTNVPEPASDAEPAAQPEAAEDPEDPEAAEDPEDPVSEAGISEAELAAVRAEVTDAERECARCQEEVAQAERLLAQAQRRDDAAQSAYGEAVARWADLSGEAGSGNA